MIAGIPVEFILFALTLLGVAVLHRHNLPIALAGLAAIGAYKWLAQDYALALHFLHEWKLVLNLLGLLLGFAILAKHFEDSGVPDLMPRILPDDWKGGFVLLILVALMSTFLDNIAAAILGGVVARKVFNGRVSVGYLAAIVAASNAGGAGSVVGDTTTTMMWIAGVPALHVADAFIASSVALLVVGVFASRAQHRYQPIQADPRSGVHVDAEELGILSVVVLTRVLVAGLIIGGAVAGNVLVDFPALGAWIAVLIGGLFHPIPWAEAKNAWKGTLFLIALVLAASLMPVAALPLPSWHTTLGLGFVSAVFDNIPLTALALKQGGYDWGMLAFAVGYGGSMIWFGSSAGVAICNGFPEAKNTWQWIRQGWFVPVGYVLGFFVLLALLGWHPDALKATGA
ncbi:putative transport protein [Sulfuriferula multivorans]|uniref:Putative transport protein n=1 Tax=Sulfuriferula multivorans TaxID=1559896 RepID=A0A401JB84_9PROT|nr:citrate transporter [Sulfuriferula multivorans]GBL44911.1 putative transport protein [Sulfuriferula multivorans]